MFDFLVIGSGIAGLNFAINASDLGKVLIITKKKLHESNSTYAQGGIAAVLSPLDNCKKHIQDTLKAGCFHNNRKAVEFLIKHSAEAIKKLLQLGVPFDKDKSGKLLVTREGGHSMSRIAFVRDYTGKEIEKTLLKKIKTNANIRIMEFSMAFDLIVKNGICRGAYVISNKKIQTLLAKNTILCTGGVGNIYKHSTNPEIATGDGIAIGHKAGAKLNDLEFIQFHPTALNIKGKPRFLLSEAMRGEGARLLNYKLQPFMAKLHPLGDLAPRDIVARAIWQEEKKGPIYLDISHKKSSEIKIRFPTIFKKVLQCGIDITKKPIPITPAAHFSCGGIQVNLKGETTINNLFAFGEVTCTGVHGANRLASNSLLEAVVFSNEILKNKKLVQSIKSQYNNPLTTIKNPYMYKNPSTIQKKQLNNLKNSIRTIMWEEVGIIRKPDKLKSALIKLQNMQKELKQISQNNYINEMLIETRNMLITATLITKSAIKRKKSLGCHYIIKN